MNPQIKKRIKQISSGEIPEGYKRTKVGIVPINWKEKCISEICDTLGGGTPNTKKEEYWHGNIPWISSSDILNENIYCMNISRFITESAILNSATKIIPKNSILMVSRVGVGKLSISSQEVCTSQDFTNLINIKANVLYIAYYLKYLFMDKMDTLQGTSIQGITSKEIKNMKILLPNNAEQQKIADILSTQDKLIELKEKLIEEKEHQKKYLMQTLLTGKIRLKGFSGEWEKSRLIDILTPNNKTPVDDTSKYTKITVKLKLKGIEFSNINREMADTRPFYKRVKNEIIIGKQNYFNGSVAIVTEPYDGCICSNAIMSFSVKKDNLMFVYSYITQADFLKKYECLANGTGQKELSEKEFLNFEVMIPSLKEQTSIAEILSKADEEIELLHKELEMEKQKKKSLMQLLLTGIVRV